MMSHQNSSKPFKETVWVIGGGRFGRHTVEKLRQESPTTTIIVVDKHPVRNLPDDITFVCGDGVEWLVEQFSPNAVVTKIIPTLPLHLAAEWLKKKLSQERATVSPLEIPEGLLRLLPHPDRKGPSQIVVSHADFLCPPHCAEPDEICTYTQRQRPQPLYQLLEKVHYGAFVPLIVRSRQFSRGVGGFYPDDLWHLLKRARSLPGTPLLIGSACKCHGIIDGLLL